MASPTCSVRVNEGLSYVNTSHTTINLSRARDGGYKIKASGGLTHVEFEESTGSITLSGGPYKLAGKHNGRLILENTVRVDVGDANIKECISRNVNLSF